MCFKSSAEGTRVSRCGFVRVLAGYSLAVSNGAHYQGERFRSSLIKRAHGHEIRRKISFPAGNWASLHGRDVKPQVKIWEIGPAVFAVSGLL